MGEGGRRETSVNVRRTQDSDWRMGEGGKRETGDKRMGMHTVQCRRREKKGGEGRRRERVEVIRRRREQGDTRRGMQTYMFMFVNSKQT
jgi:hypothetical protein